jgi:hypothetical protein
MQINVTAEELEQSAALLEMLKGWQKLKGVSGQYNQGEVGLSVKGNGGVHSVRYSVDSYGVQNHSQKTAVDRCVRDLQIMLGQYATKMANEGCDIISKHMPIPVAG